MNTNVPTRTAIPTPPIATRFLSELFFLGFGGPASMSGSGSSGCIPLHPLREEGRADLVGAVGTPCDELGGQERSPRALHRRGCGQPVGVSVTRRLDAAGLGGQRLEQEPLGSREPVPEQG